MQDHSRSGRLEASTLALRKWLFSDQFDRYLSLVQVGWPAACRRLSCCTAPQVVTNLHDNRLLHDTTQQKRCTASGLSKLHVSVLLETAVGLTDLWDSLGAPSAVQGYVRCPKHLLWELLLTADQGPDSHAHGPIHS